MSDDVKIVELQTECSRLQHAMQAGVRAEMTYDDGPTSPKHLRVGVNSALVQNSALATLLVRKGVITELEYWQTQAEFWRDEVDRYQHRLKLHHGVDVKLW